VVALRPLLEPRFRGLRRPLDLGQRVEPRPEERCQHALRPIRPLAQRERARHRLEGGGEDGGPGRAAGLGLPPAQPEISVDADLEGQRGQGVAVHERGAAGGEEALVLIGVTVVQEAADGQANDGVAVELQALVVAGSGGRVLVIEGAVDERLADQLRIRRIDAEALGELVQRRSVHGRIRSTADAPR
jgi:hypothetical protein